MKISEMEKIENRVRQMILSYTHKFSNLKIEKKIYGYDVRYTNWMGEEENLVLFHNYNQKNQRWRYNYATWLNNGNLKIRLPKYDPHFIN